MLVAAAFTVMMRPKSNSLPEMSMTPVWSSMMRLLPPATLCSPKAFSAAPMVSAPKPADVDRGMAPTVDSVAATRATAMAWALAVLAVVLLMRVNGTMCRRVDPEWCSTAMVSRRSAWLSNTSAMTSSCRKRRQNAAYRRRIGDEVGFSVTMRFKCRSKRRRCRCTDTACSCRTAMLRVGARQRFHRRTMARDVARWDAAAAAW